MALVIAGERSGVGKTTVTLTLLASLCRRAIAVQSFKVGPDYIDPMFHHHVTGRACRNLDPVLTSQAYVQQCYTTYSQKSQYSLIEGVMGLFDGVSSMTTDNGQLTTEIKDFASTAHIARLLNLPVVLVIDCSRLSGSVAAIAYGYCSFDPNIKIAGLVLNRVGSDRHLCLLKNSLEPLKLPILGVLRRQDDISIPDRHLGLVPTAELSELDAVINRLADLGDSCFDWERLLPLLQSGDEGMCYPAGSASQYDFAHQPGDEGDEGDKGEEKECFNFSSKSVVRVAVARDRAFNFYYQDNLDLLQKLGAELVFWSPLADSELPENVQGIYFGGGFPEVFAQQLSENISLRKAVKTAILQGIPTIAECGGLMYLCEQIIDFAGESWPMLGVLPTSSQMGGRLTLGYRRAVALQDSLLINSGTTVYGHEFHRSQLISAPNQPLFATYRYDCEENMGFEGWALPANIHASYVHLHWGASVEIPQQFVKKCLEFKPDSQT